MGCFDSIVAVVDADNDAHGRYLLSFQNLSGIYNKRRGRPCLPRRNFFREWERFIRHRRCSTLKITLPEARFYAVIKSACIGERLELNRLYTFIGRKNIIAQEHRTVPFRRWLDTACRGKIADRGLSCQTFSASLH